ncbi:MAG TPA: hypothetical protein PKW33_01110 [Anaerolineaceae bacterium]|nr:hypothetical protein [Anaerolineaceae bacterium]HPN50155.1 hypothetical protein [Anaerolineaceae bacterium]
MTFKAFDGLIWLLLMLGPFLFLQRRVHHEIQAVFWLTFRHAEVAMILFAVLFFPGVFLHEASHFLAAKILRVRTGRVSLLPRVLPKGKLQLGFVEIYPTDGIREALIGLAPLLTGGLLVAWIGMDALALQPLGAVIFEGKLDLIAPTLAQTVMQPDFGIWFYLAFAISSSMLPSESDRRTWLPMVIFIGLMAGLVLLAGAGPWLMENLGPVVNEMLRSAALVFAISLLMHVVIWAPVVLVRKLLNRVTGLVVE